MDLDRRSFLLALLGAAGGVALGSCGGSGSDTVERVTEKTVPLRPPGELPPVARPVLHLSGADFGFPSPFSYLPPNYGRMALIYDTLLLSDATGALLPWLAGSHQPSPDGLTHSFELRPNVRWHDGAPLTAADVVFSFEYFAARRAEGKVAPWVIFRPENVADVRATGDQGVEVRLTKPVVTFTRQVAGGFPIVPRHVWSSVADPSRTRDDLKLLVGTGPYRLESYAANRGYLYVANDEFFLGRPFVKRIEMIPVGDELAALRAGEIDAGGLQASPTSAKALSGFLRDPSFGVLKGDPGFTVALNWNLAKGGALADVRFRHACARAIDRHEMVRRLLGGNGEVGNPGFLPPGHPFRIEVEQYPFDRDEANRLLDKAGYPRKGDGLRHGPGGKPLRFTLTVPLELETSVDFVIRSLDAVGIELEVDPTDQVFSIGDKYEMAYLFYGGVDGDPDYMRGVYSSKVTDKLFMAAKGYANAEFDDLAERQLTTLDEAQRKQLVARMQQIVAGDLPLLHLYYPVPFTVFKKSVFDQWTHQRQGGGPFNKQALVTGVGTGGTQIRPTT